MKSYVYRLAAVAALALGLASANAQQVKIATGGAGNTYSTVLREMAGACKDELQITEVNSAGSIANLELLLANQINGAMIQIDVLFSQANTQDLTQYRTLVNLFPEEVHVVAPAQSKLKAGGMLGVGAKPVEFNTINDLAGHRIGAAGGSVRTADLIRLQSQIAFKVVDFPDNKAVQAALDAGQIEAALYVGGQPLGSVKDLGPEYKLVAFPEQVQGLLKNVYRPGRLNYTKMGRAGAGIPTVATEAALVVQSYKTPKMVAALSAFRNCVLDKVEEQRETLGTHPAWKRIPAAQNTDPATRGKWPWLDLPSAAPAAPATPAKPARKG